MSQAVTINCADCGICCSQPNLVPILFPHETGLPHFATEVRTAHGVEFHTLKKNHDGTCAHYVNGRCSIHEQRPLECVLYPIMVDLSLPVARLAIDTKQCPPDRMARAVFDPRHLSVELSQIRAPTKWREAYQKLKQ